MKKIVVDNDNNRGLDQKIEEILLNKENKGELIEEIIDKEENQENIPLRKSKKEEKIKKNFEIKDDFKNKSENNFVESEIIKNSKIQKESNETKEKLKESLMENSKSDIIRGMEENYDEKNINLFGKIQKEDKIKFV